MVETSGNASEDKQRAEESHLTASQNQASPHIGSHQSSFILLFIHTKPTGLLISRSIACSWEERCLRRPVVFQESQLAASENILLALGIPSLLKRGLHAALNSFPKQLFASELSSTCSEVNCESQERPLALSAPQNHEVLWHLSETLP